MRCLDEEQLLAIATKRLAVDADVVAHLATCPDCRRLVALAVRGEDAPTRRAARAGDVVGERYVLEERLGGGAMGEVWSARAGNDDTRVALKLPRHVDEPALLQRALREARLVRTLDHPNIVRIYDVLEAPTGLVGPVLVMELLQGETLQDRLQRERRLDLRRASGIAAGIAAALVHAHEKGIIHRDLKPSNVMLIDDGGEGAGRVKLLDFGLARPETWSASEPRLTATGDVVGTLVTMSPEQVFGERLVDARTDVWALGVMLYRMLAGTYPIDAQTPGALMKWFRQGRIRPIESCVNGLPLDVAAIVMQALEIDRNQRIGGPGELLTVLRRHV